MVAPHNSDLGFFFGLAIPEQAGTVSGGYANQKLVGGFPFTHHFGGGLTWSPLEPMGWKAQI